MEFPKIQIQTTRAILGLNIEKPKQHIEQPKAELQIQQPAAILSIETTRGQLHIDSSQARRDLGLIGPLESTKNYAEKGRQAVLDGIARRASQGQQLKSIGKGGNALASIIAQNTNVEKKPLSIKFVPSVNSVKTSYTPASVDINFETNKPKIDATINKPIHDYQPGKVTGEMLQNPTIKIDVQM